MYTYPRTLLNLFSLVEKLLLLATATNFIAYRVELIKKKISPLMSGPVQWVMRKEYLPTLV